MNARELMTESVVTVSAAELVELAIRKMKEHRIGGMPVVDEEYRVAGIVSESDLLGAPESSPVGEVMTHSPQTVSEDTSVEEIAMLLTTRSVNRLPVVREGRLVGIITRDDVIAYLANIRAWKSDLGE